MTLDEAINILKSDNDYNKSIGCDTSYEEQLAEWLEELKFLKQWKSDIIDSFCKYDASSFEELVTNARNKAIDDYMSKLCNHCMQQTNECYKLECPFCTDGCDIVNISEQLKVGVTND